MRLTPIIQVMGTIPHHTTIPYHTIPYHTIPYHTIPYHTIPHTSYTRSIYLKSNYEAFLLGVTLRLTHVIEFLLNYSHELLSPSNLYSLYSHSIPLSYTVLYTLIHSYTRTLIRHTLIRSYTHTSYTHTTHSHWLK